MQSVQGRLALIGLDANTGAMTFLYKPPDSTYAFTVLNNPNCGTSSGTALSTLSPPTVGPDGTVYSVVSQFNLTVTDGCLNGPLSYTLTNSLLQVAPDGSTSLTQLRQDVSNQTYNGASFAGFFNIPGTNLSATLYQPIPKLSPFHVIPDGQGGVLVPYAFQVTADFAPGPPTGRITHMASGGALNDFSLPLVPIAGTVLGENGTAFATDASSVVSFSTLGSVNWTYQPSQGTSCMAALDNGTLLLEDRQMNQISINASGVPTVSAGGIDGCNPKSLNLWYEPSNARTSLAVGSSTLLASIWPLVQGGRPTENSAQPLIYAEFIPTSPGVPGDPRFGSMELAKDDILKNVMAPNIGNFPFWDQGATVDKFLSVLADPIAAVAFIGHAYEYQPTSGPTYSVGLFLKDKALIKSGSVANPNPQYPYVSVDQIHSQAKVVFIASCEVGPVFLSLWDIDDSTPSRALVVPDQAAMATWQLQNGTSFDLGIVDLAQGTVAWEALAKALASGSKLDAAVTAANNAVAQFYGGIPVNQRQSALAIWKAIGGTSGANICLTTCN